ncbi:hypothetical protein ACMC56_07875 [Campylobacterota bacterium DY0563]
MNEMIMQNPIISLIIVLVPTVAVVWKVMEVLYIKPREFRINALENNVNELQNEIKNIEKKSSSIEIESEHIVSSETEVKIIKKEDNKTKPIIDEATLYQTLENLFNQWNNDDITELQKTKIEKTSIGKRVIWDVYVTSISKIGLGDERIMLFATANKDDRLSSPSTAAIFDIKYEDSLLLLQKDDKVTISGKISSFGISIMIDECEIIKKFT